MFYQWRQLQRLSLPGQETGLAATNFRPNGKTDVGSTDSASAARPFSVTQGLDESVKRLA